MASEGSERRRLGVGTRPHLTQHGHRTPHGLGVRRVQGLRQELSRVAQLALLEGGRSRLHCWREEGQGYIDECRKAKVTSLNEGRSRFIAE